MNDYNQFSNKYVASEEVSGESSIAQWLAFLLHDPAAPGLIRSVPEIFSEENNF